MLTLPGLRKTTVTAVVCPGTRVAVCGTDTQVDSVLLVTWLHATQVTGPFSTPQQVQAHAERLLADGRPIYAD
jgi:hypothetical protein